MNAGSHSVLLVDDNPDQVDLAAELLRLKGFFVSTAQNGIEALSALKAKRFSCLVTDLFMPEMDGVELISHVRRYDPAIKVIAVSGRSLGRTDYLRAATLIGAHVNLVKPVEPDRLIEALHSLCG
jgi:CheY-like chemotaxis protein